MLVHAAFVGLLCLANIDSVAAVAGIIINSTRHWQIILEYVPRSDSILAFVYEPLVYLGIILFD